VNVSASAVSLNVSDERTSADFLIRHFGFAEEMASDGFVSLKRPDVDMNVIYLRTGLTTFKPEPLRGRHADGLLLVFVVDDVDAEYARLEAEVSRSQPPSRPSHGASATSRYPTRTAS
jgi:hypothetical protein